MREDRERVRKKEGKKTYREQETVFQHGIQIRSIKLGQEYKDRSQVPISGLFMNLLMRSCPPEGKKWEL